MVNNMEKLNLIEVEQPIGTFYLGKIDSKILVNYSRVNPRDKDNGIQRQYSIKRVKEIANYCKDPDATFPTPIIVSITTEKILDEINTVDFSEEKVEDIKKSIIRSELIKKTNDGISIDLSGLKTGQKVFEIIDGQHRVLGIEEAQNFSCQLVVVLMIDLTEEEKAYIFSTINSNQTKVDKSLIYDLFDLSKTRSPFKTAHYIARNMNTETNSPFKNKLKMLGKKEYQESTLSQGTFVFGILKLISKDPKDDTIKLKNNEPLQNYPKYPLRSLFINEQDHLILKILTDYFNAVKEVFPEEWKNNTSVLTKTTGYLGLIILFKELLEIGLHKNDISFNFFWNVFIKIKKGLDKEGLSLNSSDFPAGAQGQNKLALTFLTIYFNMIKNNE